MSEQLAQLRSFVEADYAVFTFMLILSAAIGIYFAFLDRSERNSGEFLTGGRKLSALPVSLSLTASFMSAVTVLANPAEVYRYGANFAFIGIAFLVMVLVTSEVFIPVFYKLSITSTYEYLELRFNRATRLLGTVIFIVQTILYTGIVIYAPALALNHVTGLDLWGAVISTGLVCTFYCTVGGLKAVVWTDVFQVGIMLAGFLSVIIRSLVLQGGFTPIFSDAQQGGRLNFWDFDTNPMRRHTFWTLSVGGSFVWISIYGISQTQVQRYVSCKTITHARLALFINLFAMLSIMLSAVFSGLCLYSMYKNCDPWTTGRISAIDQLMPLLVMDILTDYPGLPGLFVAAAYSGSLSTASSSINALAAVTVEDLIKPYTKLSEKQLSWTSKGLSLLYGFLCLAMTGLASIMEEILQAVVSIYGITGGPLLGLFTMGILFPFANSKGAVSGLVAGLVLSLWVGLGAQVYPPPPEMTRPLPLSTAGCNLTTLESSNWTSTLLPAPPTSASGDSNSQNVLADWYSLSYLYFCPLGTLTALSVGLFVSVLTGGCKKTVEPRLTLHIEDTATYQLYKFLRYRVTRRSKTLHLTQDKEKFGNTNLAFIDVELETTKTKPAKWNA